jgi:thermostable 8-oxoguanine DNA glycosylase
MGRLDRSIIKESEERLRELLRQEKDARVYKRRVIYLIKTMEKPTLKKVAKKVGIVKTAFDYWDWYKKGGRDIKGGYLD